MCRSPTRCRTTTLNLTLWDETFRAVPASACCRRWWLWTCSRWWPALGSTGPTLPATPATSRLCSAPPTAEISFKDSKCMATTCDASEGKCRGSPSYTRRRLAGVKLRSLVKSTYAVDNNVGQRPANIAATSWVSFVRRHFWPMPHPGRTHCHRPRTATLP